MHNKLLNKKVISALSIGLSAAIALQPVTAYAAPEEELTPTGDALVEAVNLDASVEKAEVEVIDRVDAEVLSVDEAAEGVKKVNEEGFAGKNDAQAQAVETAVSELDAAMEADENGKTIDDKVDAVISDLTTAKAQEKAYKDAEGTATEAAKEASEAAWDAIYDKEASESKEYLSDATDDVNAKDEEIKSATTIVGAQQSYDEAEKIANEATEKFEAAVAQYDEAVEKFDAAKKDMEAAEKAYDEAIASAQGDVEVAKAALDEAAKKAAALEAAVEAAKDAMGMQAALSISEMEKEAEAGKFGDHWGKLDQLFREIVKNYYVPAVLGGTDVTVSEANKEYKDYSNSGEFNYFEVSYTDENGEKVTKFLAYKTADCKEENADNANVDPASLSAKGWCDLQIYEKTLEFITSVEKNNDKFQSEVADKYHVIVDNGETFEIDKDDAALAELRKNKNMFEIKDSNGQVIGYYLISNPEVNPTDAQYLEGSSEKLIKSLTDGTAKDIFYTIGDDGKLYKNVTKNVTTVKVADKWGASATYINVLTDTTTKNQTWYERVTASATAAAFDLAAKHEHDDDYVISRDGSISCGEDRWEGATTGSGHWEKGLFGIPYWVQDEWPNPGHYECTISGTVTVKYAKTDIVEEDYKTFWAGMADFFDFANWFHESNKAAIEKAAKAKIEAEGGIYVGTEGWNWDAKTADIKYVPASKVSVEQIYNSKEEAEAAAKAKITGESYNVKTNATSKDTTEYGDVTKSVEVNGKSTSVEAGKYLYTNKEWESHDKETLFNEYADEGFKAWKEAAKNYQTLLEEAKQANDLLATAKANLDDLQQKALELSIQKAFDKETQKELQVALEEEIERAKGFMEDAKGQKELLDEALEQAKKDLQDKIRDLTPGGGDGGDGGNGDDSTPTRPANLPGEGNVPAVASQGRAVAMVAAPAAVEEVVEIAPERTPLAPTVEEAKEEAPKLEVELTENETALAPAPIAEEKISWWWLLVIAALGATGYELYKKHREKEMAKSDK